MNMNGAIQTHRRLAYTQGYLSNINARSLSKKKYKGNKLNLMFHRFIPGISQ